MAFMKLVQTEFAATREDNPAESLTMEIGSEVEPLEIRQSVVRFRIMGEFGIFIAPLNVFEENTLYLAP
jgi:hypothetical protein